MRALLAGLLAGCAGVACRPETVVVAAKEQRTRLVWEDRGVRTTETGYVREDLRAVPVREYWIRAESGEWFLVPESAWRSVEPGRSLGVCR